MTNIKLSTREGATVRQIHKVVRDLIDSIDVKPDQVIVDYGCSEDGHIVGLMLARHFPSSTIYLVADNIKDAKTIGRNLQENNLQGASVHIDDRLSFLEGNKVDRIIINSSGYEGKETLRAKIVDSWQHLALGGELYLLAHMRHGAPFLMQTANEIFGNHEIVKKSGAGMRVIRATRTTDQVKESYDNRVEKHIQAWILGGEYTFQTTPTLFSKDQIDLGSLLLLEALEIGEGQEVLDLGCGYGVLGIVIANQHQDKQVTLVDIELQAIKAAAANVRLNAVQRNTQVILSDGFEELQGATFDLIISHFPLHIPKREQERLLSGAKDALNVGGRFCMVAHSTYDLRPLLRTLFDTVSVITDTSERAIPGERYRVLCATKV